MRLRSLAAIGASLTLALGGMLATAGPATASSYVMYVYQGGDYGTFDEVTHSFSVCDKENDGHQVYVYFEKLDNSKSSRVYDPDSYGGGCGGGTLGAASSSNPWDLMWVCEDIPVWSDNCNADGVIWR
ncbi:hypothetical protein [Streptomyces spiralis]|uniref:hypothetical protein n=1 Tax=Streptomyces spiralis TaxID=66376 RepID=UPI0036B7C018